MSEVSKWYNPIDTTNDTEVKSVSAKIGYGIPCGVCGEVIGLNELQARYVTFMLCPECIKAIKFAKTLMKNNPNMNVDGDDGK